MGQFDDQMAEAVSESEEAFGVTATLNFVLGGSQAVTVLKVSAKPRLVPAASADQEYRELEVRISAVAYPEPKVLFAGGRADWFSNLFDTPAAADWFIVDVLNENDPTMHRLVLRDKQIPKEYGFGG